MQIQTTKNSKRGFFFTAMALAILSFMLLTTQVWVRTFELKDNSAAVRFKGEAMRTVLSVLSDGTMSEFANASAFYAVSKLADATAKEGLAPAAAHDPENPGTGNVENTTYELMMHGNSSPGTLQIAYSPDKKEAYTISAWQDKIRAAANVMGFNASFGKIENFTIAQADPWTVRTYFEMQMNISDFENTMHQSKRLRANTSFSINGFVDPMVVRNELERRPGIARDPSLVAQKQIWKHLSYNAPSDISPRLVDERIGQGNGWFFGPITSDYPGEGIFNGSEMDKIGQYILVHKYDGNLSAYAPMYGAIILTESPVKVSGTYTNSEGCNVTEINETNCLNCLQWTEVNSGGCAASSKKIYANQVKDADGHDVPVIVAGGDWSSNSSNIPVVSREGMPVPKQSFVLIDNEFSDAIDKERGYHRIWDITRIRDMSICGFYVQGKGPSFFQRMLANPVGGAPIVNPDLGIESFLVGQWAGGKEDKDKDINSRLDWEFYSNAAQQAAKIKGMMGCKSKAMCGGANATNEGTGHFRLSMNATSRYGLDKISCQTTNGINGGSPCE